MPWRKQDGGVVKKMWGGKFFTTLEQKKVGILAKVYHFAKIYHHEQKAHGRIHTRRQDATQVRVDCIVDGDDTDSDRRQHEQYECENRTVISDM